MTDHAPLTDAGWPRPRVDGWPVPWVSPSTDLSQFNDARHAACASGAICQVCGLGYQNDEHALILLRQSLEQYEASREAGDLMVIPIDNGVLHERCLRLALAWCPELKRRRATGDLILLRVIAHAADPEYIDPAAGAQFLPDVLYATFTTTDCELAPWPDE